ncbi:acid protease [Auricularia subglabra TFB-10046 SS5]|nr:acid protease [Auricularia subglabra TFB-10046 SS5]
MQLTSGFSTLLVSVLAVTSGLSGVDARPAMRRNDGLVHLPLHAARNEQRDGLHPHIYFQQHVNRALRRHARLNGREGPSDEQLAARIVRRAEALEQRGEDHGLQRRYWTKGWVQEKLAGLRNSQPAKVVVADLKAGPTQGKGAHAVAGHSAGQNANDLKGILGAIFGNGGGAANGNAAAGNGNARKKGKGRGRKGKNGGGNGAGAGGNAGGNAGNAGGADVGGAGFSEIDLQAANAGGLTAANNPQTDNTLPLDIEANDVGYISPVLMGTPPREFKLLMDSGSSDLWVGGENCQSEDGGGCGDHTFLGEQSSSTFVDSGNVFAVQYGSGDVNGTIITDDIGIGGLKLTAHTFGVATQESVDFSDNGTPFDGLMGLAQSILSQQGVLTPPEALAKQGLINDAIVSYKISRLSDGLNDGQVTFGGLDDTKFDPQTLVAGDNINQDGFWELPVDGISVDGGDLGLNGRTAILDTGTTLIIASQDDVNAIHAAIPGAQSDGQGGFTIPCTTTASVAFGFNGATFDINPQDLLFVPVDQNDLQGDCISGIIAGDIGGPPTQMLLGDVFLKNAYFSTDVTKNTISLAKLV